MRIQSGYFKLLNILLFLLAANGCPYAPWCDCDQETLDCRNIDRFNELNFTKVESTLKFRKILITPRLRERLVPESNLNLDSLVIDTTHGATVQIANVDEFDFNFDPLRGLNNFHHRHTIILKLVNSTFKLKLNNTPLNNRCDNHLLELTPGFGGLLNQVNFLILENVKFVEPICPFMFRNSRLAIFQIENALGTLQFLEVKFDQKKAQSPLNFTVQTMIFKNLFFEKINTSILHPVVYNTVKSIIFDDIDIGPGWVDNHLFENNFGRLKHLEIKLKHWKQHTTRSFKFLKYLNNVQNQINLDSMPNSTKINLKEKFILHLIGSDYFNFERDTDVCMFEQFPFDRLVIPYVFTASSVCTCTIKWLNRYIEKFQMANNDVDYGRSANADCNWINCNFDEMVANCNWYNDKISSSERTKTHYLIVTTLIIVVLVLLVVLTTVGYKRWKGIKSNTVMGRSGRKLRTSDPDLLELTPMETSSDPVDGSTDAKKKSKSKKTLRKGQTN